MEKETKIIQLSDSWILWITSHKINERHMKLYRKLHFMHLKTIGGDFFPPLYMLTKSRAIRQQKIGRQSCGLLLIDLIGIAVLYIYDLTSDLHFLFTHSTRRYCTIQPNKSVKKNIFKSWYDL